jgi:MFS family permease
MQRPSTRRRLWVAFGGPEVPPAIRPLILSAALQSLATSGFSTYVGIWAIEELHAGSAALGVALFLRAFSGVATGYLGGRLSDRIGRRPVILASWAAQTVCILSFAFVGRAELIGLVLIVAFGPLGPPGSAATAAYVADAVEPTRRETAFAALRTARSVSVVLGPPLAALLVIGGHWPILFIGLASCSAVAVAVASRLIPRAVTPRLAAPAASGTSANPLRDLPYVLLLTACTLITLSLAATDRFLPIAAVTQYHLSASAWGPIVILNPLLIVLLQLPVSRLTQPLSRVVRLIAAAALTALPFLLFLFDTSVVTIVAVVVLSTFGEMLWLPTSQALAADAAPDADRGAYLGAFDGATSVSFAVGPMVALEINGAAGAVPVWWTFAAIGVAGAVVGTIVLRAHARRHPVLVGSAGSEGDQ